MGDWGGVRTSSCSTEQQQCWEQQWGGAPGGLHCGRRGAAPAAEAAVNGWELGAGLSGGGRGLERVGVCEGAGLGGGGRGFAVGRCGALYGAPCRSVGISMGFYGVPQWGLSVGFSLWVPMGLLWGLCVSLRVTTGLYGVPMGSL